MRNLLVLIICVFLSGATCKKENCPFIITIKNQSGEDILLAKRATNQGKCFLDGNLLAKDEVFEYRPFNTCISKNLCNQNPMIIYWVKVDEINIGPFYDCDSIYIKNNVLKKYTLTMETLIQTNFTIIYQ